MGLAAELEAIVGADGVDCDVGSLATYESDAFTLVRSRPDMVVLPRSTDEVAAVVRATAHHRFALVPRGAGTSLAGGTIAVEGGLCVSMARMRRILSIDPRNRCARVQAGVVNAAVSRAVNSYGLHYAPDPSSQTVCTIGGNVATNAGGPHTLRCGVTANHVLGVTVVLADGRIEQFGGEYDDADAADLLGLVVGSEGTLGIVTEVVVRLTPTPPAVRTLLVVFDAVEAASRTISAIIAAGIVPMALEMVDAAVIGALEDWLNLGLPRDAGAVLIIEIDGLEPGLDRRAQQIRELCLKGGCREVRSAADEDRRAELWMARKKAYGALGRLGMSLCTQDGVVPPSKVPDILRFIGEVAARRDIRIANILHAGDGNIHPNFIYDERDARQVRAVVEAGYEILARCVELGGTVTGEHGIGIEKVEHLRRMLDADSLAVQGRVRDAFDPNRRMNPGKVLLRGGGCIEVLRPPRGIPA